MTKKKLREKTKRDLYYQRRRSKPHQRASGQKHCPRCQVLIDSAAKQHWACGFGISKRQWQEFQTSNF